MEPSSLIHTSVEPETPKRFLSYQQSYAQRLLDAGRGSYAQVRLELIGRLDIARLRRACDALVARHEILRTAEDFAVCDVTLLPAAMRARSVQRCAEMCGDRAVRSASTVALGAVVLRSSDSRHDLVLTFSPLVADAATLRQCCDEIVEDYHTARPRESTLPYA